MSFLSNLFRRKKNSNIENFAGLLSNMTEKGGANLAVIFNNAGEAGMGNLFMFLGAATPQQTKELATWIDNAGEAELIQAAGYISKANAYELVNLLDWLQKHRASSGSQQQTPTPESPRVVQPETTANDIEFPCPKCSGHLVIEKSGAGMQVTCPHCSQEIQVPFPAAPKVRPRPIQSAGAEFKSTTLPPVPSQRASHGTNEAIGSCRRCGREATAIADNLGPKALPVGDLESAQQVALWCARCTKVFCGKCCGAVPGISVLKFRCPACGDDVKWAKTEHWRMSR